MQLDTLELENFRQFRDESISFARGTERGVTVVHGANGSGKTTILNAFTWLFYEKVDFDTRPDRLASEGAMADADVGDDVTVSVRLRFDHDSVEYVAQRTATYTKRSPNDFDGELSDADIELQYRAEGTGRWESRQNPSSALDQVLPERLSGLFFFDGEDIDELAGIDNQERIQEAIQNIMGLTILERATRHLDTVAGRFEDEVAEYASDELSELIAEKKSVRADVEDFEQQLTNTERSISEIENDITQIEEKLTIRGEAKDIQMEREDRQQERNEVEAEIEELTDEIKTELNRNAFLPLAMPLLESVGQELDEMREEGIIPSELSNSFIDSLLESRQCFCGRPLEPGTEHYKQVQAMRGETIADGVEQAAVRIIGHLNEANHRESGLFDTIDRLVERRKQKYEERRRLEETIDELSTKLRQSEETAETGESIAELERRREQLEEQKEQKIAEQGRIEQQIDEASERIGELEDEIEEMRDEREEALVAKRREKAAEQVGNRLQQSFDELKDKVRKVSNRKVQETFSKIASKDLTAEITEDFELKIWQDVGDERVEVDKSTGERQVASLAFIGSLVSIARERYETDSDSEYFTGGIYPIVMDSPFGALDKDHRREVSRVIPELGNQVVVFATDSQWEGPVEEEMASVAGEQYWLDFDSGEGTGNYPQTKIKSERATVRGD